MVLQYEHRTEYLIARLKRFRKGTSTAMFAITKHVARDKASIYAGRPYFGSFRRGNHAT
jgi:hypothetical protein